MSEDGTLNNLKRKWWYDRSECPSGTTKVSKSTQFENFLEFHNKNRIRNKIMHLI